MKRTFVGAALAAILIAAPMTGGQDGPGPSAQAQGGALKLSLSDAVRRALEANLDLAIEVLNPEMDEASAAAAREAFLPTFGLSSNYVDQEIPNSWGLEGPTVKTRRDYYQFGVSQRTPLGTEIDLALSTQTTDTSRAFTTVNPAFDSIFQLSLRQPLLQGFGSKVNRYESIKAGRRLDMSEASLKATLLQTIYGVEQAYWNLTYARESLRVLEMSLAQSREMFRRNQEAARVGTKTGVDVLSSEAEVANYEDGILAARRQVERAENALRTLLGFPVAGAAAAGGAGAAAPEPAAEALIAADEPRAERRTIAFEEALATAFAERPELARVDAALADAATDVGYFKNQLLPRLDLNLQMWYPGQSGVRYVFQDDNPLSGIVIGKIAGSRADSFKDVWKMTYGSVSFNVSLTLPLSNVISRAELARARLAQEQARLRLEKERRAIEAEVVDAVRDLEASARRIDTSARYRELMEKRVAAETQRYDLGLVGSEWLFTYQRSLAQAKADEIRAVIDYRIALAALDKAMGTTLRTKGLKFKGYEF
ncbi:MAG: TolC family protein [Candidatus Aminicenantes bacterium]|nr:TolC family protein [Candidatus Aminicenantes bacterium]